MVWDVSELLIDIKAAVRLGQYTSLRAALEDFEDLPDVRSNAALDDGFVTKVILPLGFGLAGPQVNADMLQPLTVESLAGLRALAAVALAAIWAGGRLEQPEYLAALGRDARREVRLALSLALRERTAGDVLQLLLASWLSDASPRLRETAVRTLAALEVDPVLALIQNLDSEHDESIRAALAASLTDIAQSDHAQDVLPLLANWAKKPQPNTWVISQVLSGGWAAVHAEQTLDILESLTNSPKDIRRVLRALQRHDAEPAVNARLGLWTQAENKTLNTIATKWTQPNENTSKP
jgi:hypothetical protein